MGKIGRYQTTSKHKRRNVSIILGRCCTCKFHIFLTWNCIRCSTLLDTWYQNIDLVISPTGFNGFAFLPMLLWIFPWTSLKIKGASGNIKLWFCHTRGHRLLESCLNLGMHILWWDYFLAVPAADVFYIFTAIYGVTRTGINIKK